MDAPRLVIAGAGFAGTWAALGAARTLDRAGRRDVEVVLVSPEPTLELRPRLHERDLAPARVDLRGLLAAVGVRHRAARVVGLDEAAGAVELDGDEPGRLRHDALVIATGSRSEPPRALPGADACHRVDTWAQATALRAALRPGTRVAVVGGGFTGIELAAELAAQADVTLLERGPHVGGGFGPEARGAIDAALDALGVAVRTRVEPASLEASALGADLVAWTGGLRADELALAVGGPHDAAGRVVVDDTLRAPGARATWVAGDCAAAPRDDRHATVMCCQHAIPTGVVAGTNAARALVGGTPHGYAQPLYLTCLDLGDAGALLTEGARRERVLATGQDANRVKRHINGLLIVPPDPTARRALRRAGTPPPSGVRLAAVARRALRSSPVRRMALA